MGDMNMLGVRNLHPICRPFLKRVRRGVNVSATASCGDSFCTHYDDEAGEV